MIHIIATIEVHPGKRDAVLREIRVNIPKVRAEKGCLQYETAVDFNVGLPRQVPYRENAITIIEKWQTLDDLKAHLAAPHMAEYRERVKDMVVGAALQVLEPA